MVWSPDTPLPPPPPTPPPPLVVTAVSLNCYWHCVSGYIVGVCCCKGLHEQVYGSWHWNRSGTLPFVSLQPYSVSIHKKKCVLSEDSLPMWWTVTFIAKLGATPNLCQHPASSQVSRVSGKDYLRPRESKCQFGRQTPNSDAAFQLWGAEQLDLHCGFQEGRFNFVGFCYWTPNVKMSTIQLYSTFWCSHVSHRSMLFVWWCIYSWTISWFYLGIQGIHCLFHFLGSQVLTDGYWREYPWTVKVDPDAATRQMLEVEIAEGFNKGMKRKIMEN